MTGLYKNVSELPIGTASLGYAAPLDLSLSQLLEVAERMDNSPSAPLQAFWVGDMDIYAAHSAEQALELCEEHSGMPDVYELDDVDAVTAETLDKPLVEEDGTPCGTLRQLLAETSAPGYLMGVE